jgi:hypothetical protein
LYTFFFPFFSLPARDVTGLEDEDWLAPVSLAGSAANTSELLREFMGVEAWRNLLGTWAASDEYRGPAREVFWLPCVSADYPHTGPTGTAGVLHLDGDSWDVQVPLLPILETLSRFSTPPGDPHPVTEMPCLLLSFDDGPIYRLPAVMHCMYVGWFWSRFRFTVPEANVLMRWECPDEDWSTSVSGFPCCVCCLFLFFSVRVVFS